MIDDDDDSREVIGVILDLIGYASIAVKDGAEALSVLRDEPVRPALIVLDVWMPGLNGFEFRCIQSGKEGWADIPVVVASAAPLTEADLATLCPTQYLRKPFGAHEFSRAVRAATGVA